MMLLNIVDSNKQSERVFVAKSQTMQEPSDDAVTACESSWRTLMHQTRPRCSFKDASIVVVDLLSRQTRTSPSIPPLMTRLLSLVGASAVTPFLWASLITQASFPL